MKKVGAIGCELCGSPANTYCESDQARLCWNCDDKVHGANFLVAKHTRTLLCHLCQSPTSWSASGPKLTPSMSFCLSCLNRNKTSSSLSTTSLQDGHVSYEDHDHHLDDGSDDVDTDDDIDDSIESHDDGEEEEDDDDDDYRSYSEDDDDDDDDENQVVPWTSTPVESTTASGSTSSETEELLFSSSSLKRKREISY